MQRSILDLFPDEEISLMVVWMRMYEADSLDAAENASELFRSDDRVVQFYDPEKMIGLAIAKGLGAEEDEVAWDVYLFYDGGARWGDRPPEPLAWAHQLSESSWADPSRFHQGEDLAKELQDLMEDLIKGGRAA